jgi:hypothetical protein
MRITIFPSDRSVIVNGDHRIADDHIVFPSLHCIQWYGDHGEIEHVKHVKPNEKIDSIEPYMYLIDHHAIVSKRENALDAEREEGARREAINTPTMQALIEKIEALEKKLAG